MESSAQRSPQPDGHTSPDRAIEAERALREITGELARLRDPGAVLDRVVRAAQQRLATEKRLVAGGTEPAGRDRARRLLLRWGPLPAR